MKSITINIKIKSYSFHNIVYKIVIISYYSRVFGSN